MVSGTPSMPRDVPRWNKHAFGPVAGGSGRIGRRWRQSRFPASQKQISLSVTSGAAAVKAWRNDPSLDAWVTFRTWHYRLPQETEIFPQPGVKTLDIG